MKHSKAKKTQDSYMVNGSYTIEAALILPIILLIISSLIYLSFYLYDQNKLETTINEALLLGRNLIRNETQLETGFINYEAYNKRGILYFLQDNSEEKQDQIYHYLQSKLSKGFIIAKVRSIDLMVSHSDISITVQANMELPFLGLYHLFSKSGTTVVGKNSATIGNNAEFIRIFDIFSSVAEKVPVINDNLIKLQQILNRFKK